MRLGRSDDPYGRFIGGAPLVGWVSEGGTMKNVIRPVMTVALVIVVSLGAPSIPVAAASPARPEAATSPARPDYYNLCANPLFKWLCPR